MSVIINTTVLSNFAIINELGLLRQLFGTIYIPTEVYEEIQIPIPCDRLDIIAQA
jgi:predicted nucleic acid-binding protein